MCTAHGQVHFVQHKYLGRFAHNFIEFCIATRKRNIQMLRTLPSIRGRSRIDFQIEGLYPQFWVVIYRSVLSLPNYLQSCSVWCYLVVLQQFLPQNLSISIATSSYTKYIRTYAQLIADILHSLVQNLNSRTRLKQCTILLMKLGQMKLIIYFTDPVGLYSGKKIIFVGMARDCYNHTQN